MGFLAQGYEKFYGALFDGLKDLGYQEGRNLIVERRYAEGRSERFQEFAAEMVRLKVDVIIVTTTPAGFAVKSPNTNIPVVFPNAVGSNRKRPHRKPRAFRRQYHRWRSADR